MEQRLPPAIFLMGPTASGKTSVAIELADELDAELIGANREAIRVAEDRQMFKEAMIEIGLEVPHSGIAHTIEEAEAIAQETGFL